MKRRHYRIYSINLPVDLKERIAAIHAAGILKSVGGNRPVQAVVHKINKSANSISK